GEAAACGDIGAFIIKVASARIRAVIENREAAVCAADCAGVVVECAAACGRSTVKLCEPTKCAAESAAGVRETCPCRRRRTVRECYRSFSARSINSSHKMLRDSGAVGDARAANGQCMCWGDSDREDVCR